MGRPAVNGLTRRTTDDGTEVVLATVHRAETGRGPAHAATIDITEPLPDDIPSRDPQALALHYERWRDDAEHVHTALSHALPGGTLDALFALMAADRASAYVVPAAYHDTAGKLRELVAGVDALVDLFEGEETRPGARTEPEVEARLGPVCGTPLHPPAPDDVEPCGIRCVLDDGHEDYHTDGSGNRWTT